MIRLSENLQDAIYHGHEEIYLEYKGDVPWSSNPKKIEIIQTIFALSNQKDGGIIIIGINNNGVRVGLSDKNYNTYSHDEINQCLANKGNQPILCKVEKIEHTDLEDNQVKKFVIIQVSESKEFPLIYIGHQKLYNETAQPLNSNIALRTGALYIRNKLNIGNKIIENIHEWQELIERTHRKFEKETIRRSSIISKDKQNPFDKELKI